jgi:hypothetical protein
MNEEFSIGLIVWVSIIYPLLVYRVYKREYGITPEHKRNRELHQPKPKGALRRGWEWD